MALPPGFLLTGAVVAFVAMLGQKRMGSQQELDVVAIKSVLESPELQMAMFQHPVKNGPELHQLIESSTVDQLLDLADRAFKQGGRADVALALTHYTRERIGQQMDALLKRIERNDAEWMKALNDIQKTLKPLTR